jgi:hypothetical protein
MMKSVILSVVSVLALMSSGQARIDCHHDPVCQAKRDGTSVEDARRRDGGMTACLRAVGYTQEDWHAYRVPPGPAEKARSCLRAHGLPAN